MNVLGAVAKRIRSSLALQLVLAVVFLHTVLIGLLVWELVVREGEALVDQRVGRAEGIAAMLATSGTPWVLSDDSAALNELVTAASAMKQLRYSMFIDPTGRVLAHTRPGVTGKHLDDPRSKSLRTGPPLPRLIARTATTIDAAAPIRFEGRTIGWAWSSVDLRDIAQRQKELAIRGIGLGAAAIILGLIVSLLTAKSVTRRLEDLAAVSNRFRLGERNVRVLEMGHDEVAAAAKGVNAMLETVAASEQSLEEAQRIAKVGRWRYDASHATLSWSAEVYRLFGVDPSEPPPSPTEFLSRLPEEQQALLHALIRGTDDRQTVSFTFAVARPDGSERTCWTEAHVEHSPEHGGKVMVGVCQDVTERETAAAQLRQAQKMEAVGQLTGGLAHDFNNLLAIIIGNLDFLEEEFPQGEVHECIAEALGAALRGSELTQQLLAFSRRQPLAPQPIDLNELVCGMATLWRRTLGEAIDVRIDLDDDLWVTKADPSQVESAILNLVINARDAMPEGGALTVETRNVRIDPGDGGAEADLAGGDYCVIAVSDTGQGMSAEVAARAFEPFFTTKSVGRGSGLGLSMIYGFAKQSGGQVKIYSEPGHGTVVRLYLPRSLDSSNATTPAPDRAEPPRGSGEPILLVEDNESVRRVTARQLEELGYRVIVAESGAEALAVIDSGTEVDLLFTDVVMPGGMHGVELARNAVVRRPGLKVLYTSGFTRLAVEGQASVPSEILLSKPYRKFELALRLREIIDNPAPELMKA